MKNSYKSTKSSGFTLIELLVVVAILGIIAGIGILSYNGYISGAKRKSAENVMQQIALGQSEYYSDQGSYYDQGSSCSPTESNSDLIEKNLLGGADNIDPKNDYHFCVGGDTDTNYIIYAEQISGTCKLELDGLNRWCESQGTGKCSC